MKQRIWGRSLALVAVLACMPGCKDEAASDGKAVAGDKAADDKAAANDGKAAAGDKKPVDDKKPADEKPPAVAPEAGTVRVAVVFGDELLKSEARAIAAATKKLAKSKNGTFDIGNATDAEKAVAAAYFGDSAPGAIPSEWAKTETIVVLNMLPPLGKKPKRHSQGLGNVLILRPPSTEPVFHEKVEGDAGNTISGEGLAKWIDGFVAATKGSN